MLKGKKILLGITGSIAAYKSALLARLLVKEGADVKIITTPAANDFITPLTLSTLSKNPVFSKMYDPSTGEWINHVELALWADMMVIAPASANTLAKMANGLCDNLLLAVYLSARCPVFVAPAMDEDMYRHASVRASLKKLSGYGHYVIKPGTGELASGLYGEGRMAEPEEILTILVKEIQKHLPLRGLRALVSAGPTHELIDPVRYISNRSSGKMGFAIASALADRGAEVILVSGPGTQKLNHPLVKRIDVVSADEMYKACLQEFKNVRLVVMAAAVADFKPQKKNLQKIKKSSFHKSIELVPTPDILAELGRIKKKSQVLVGFALETANAIKNARNKLKNKNLDLIVLNSLLDEGAGFEYDTNKISILDKNNKIAKFGLKSKQDAAADIVERIGLLLKKGNP